MRALLFAISFAVWCGPALARNAGQIAQDDPNREWFHRSKVHSCCDYADGHFVPWRLDTAGKYEIEVESKWWPVPDIAVKALEGEKNPYLEALAWYGWQGHYGEESTGETENRYLNIRCFIVGAGL